MNLQTHRYIEETLEQDHTKFKTITTMNPFLSDFIAVGTEGSSGDNNRDAWVLGTIGSMQGILGIL